jgi:hypothetical protein
MPRPRPPFLHRQVERGKVFWYVRRHHGTRTRLRAPYGSDEFWREYQAACAERPYTTTVIDAPRGPLAAWPIESQAPTIGVYLLLLGGEVVYVGSSLTMVERVKAHQQNGRPFDRVIFIPTFACDREDLERILIDAIQPKQNRTISKLPQRLDAEVA